MCASYIIKKSSSEILAGLRAQAADMDVGSKLGRRFEVSEIDETPFLNTLIVPSKLAPIWRLDGSVVKIDAFRFSLIPRWSKEPKVKFATHNARLETVDEKPTWKKPFVEHHCVVPLSEFIEPIYEGDDRGYMVGFESSGLLLAAGIWERWTSEDGQQVVQSFSILTREPEPFIAETGHDRCPVFLDGPGALKWLGSEGESAIDLKRMLDDHRPKLNWQKERVRPMKLGWEKRV